MLREDQKPVEDAVIPNEQKVDSEESNLFSDITKTQPKEDEAIQSTYQKVRLIFSPKAGEHEDLRVVELMDAKHCIDFLKSLALFRGSIESNVVIPPLESKWIGTFNAINNLEAGELGTYTAAECAFMLASRTTVKAEKTLAFISHVDELLTRGKKVRGTARENEIFEKFIMNVIPTSVSGVVPIIADTGTGKTVFLRKLIRAIKRTSPVSHFIVGERGDEMGAYYKAEVIANLFYDKLLTEVGEFLESLNSEQTAIFIEFLHNIFTSRKVDLHGEVFGIDTPTLETVTGIVQSMILSTQSDDPYSFADLLKLGEIAINPSVNKKGVVESNCIVVDSFSEWINVPKDIVSIFGRVLVTRAIDDFSIVNSVDVSEGGAKSRTEKTESDRVDKQVRRFLNRFIPQGSVGLKQAGADPVNYSLFQLLDILSRRAGVCVFATLNPRTTDQRFVAEMENMVRAINSVLISLRAPISKEQLSSVTATRRNSGSSFDDVENVGASVFGDFFTQQDGSKVDPTFILSMRIEPLPSIEAQGLII